MNLFLKIKCEDRMAKKIKLSSTQKVILKEIVNNKNITIQKLCDITSLSKSTIERALISLRKDGFIQRIGLNKTGYWKVTIKIHIKKHQLKMRPFVSHLL